MSNLSFSTARYLRNDFQGLLPDRKTIQLELSGGGAHGAYECGALEVLLPFWKAKGFDIDVITGVSAGAMNATLLSYIINSEQEDKISQIMGGFWDHLGRTGDVFLKPFLDMHSLRDMFNLFAAKEDQFPNIPSYMINPMKMGKSSLPLQQLKELLNDHIPPSGWDHIRTGKTETFVSTLRVDPKTRERIPVQFTGTELNASSVIASAALRDFAPYRYNGEIYEDGGYDKIGFFREDHETDVLFAIGLKPLRDAAEIQNKFGVKTGQLHHDLTRYYQNPERTCHIDFICLDHPEYWNETSAMNNTSENLNDLRRKGREDALKWIDAHGTAFGTKSSFRPIDAVLRLISNEAAPA